MINWLVPDFSLLAYLNKVHSALACHLRYLFFSWMYFSCRVFRFPEPCSLEGMSFSFYSVFICKCPGYQNQLLLWLFISLAVHIHHSIVFSFQLPCWWWAVGGDGIFGWRLFNWCCHWDVHGWRTDSCSLSGGEGSHLCFCLHGQEDASVSVVVSLCGEERADALQQQSFCLCLQGTVCNNNWCCPFKSLYVPSPRQTGL